jgi:hypothetical protein
MEIPQTWRLVDSYRNLGIPPEYSHFVTSSGPRGKKFASWVRMKFQFFQFEWKTDSDARSQDLPSVDQWCKTIMEDNDGSHPAEPYQRCSQIIFEA